MEATITRIHKLAGETITAVAVYPTAGSTGLDVTVPPATTNQVATIAVTASLLKTVLIESSQTVTIKTNSTPAPGNTWVVNPGRPLVWASEDGFFANPVAANIATIYLSNAGTAAAKVRLRFGQDGA